MKQKSIYGQTRRFHFDYKKLPQPQISEELFGSREEVCVVRCMTHPEPPSRLISRENGHFTIEIPPYFLESENEEEPIMVHAEFQVYRIIMYGGNMMEAQCVQVFPSPMLNKINNSEKGGE